MVNEDKIKEIEKIFESKTPFNDIFPTRLEEHTKRERRVASIRATQERKQGKLWETYNFPDGTNDDRWYSW